MRLIRVFLLLAMVAIMPAPAMAFDFNDLRINGFISQGYMKTNENNWLATDSVDGTFQINEVGVTFNAPVSEKLHIGIQLLARDLGNEGNNEVRLDWAYGDFRFHDSFGLRLGKTKMPVGLYNVERDSDFLRQMSFLPQSIYDENRRNLMVASQGLQIYGNVPLGLIGDVDYAAHYGQINFPDDSPTLQAFLGFANMGAGSPPGPQVWNQISADNEFVYGGQLIYNTPLDGLRLAGSYFEGKADFAVTDITGTNAPGNLRVEIQDMYIVSLEYATPWFTLSSEYVQFKQPAELNGNPMPSGPSGIAQGMYGMLTVPTPGLEQLSFTILYDVYYSDKDDKSGDLQANPMMPAYYFFRKDSALAARYDINEHWLIKAEYHKINGADLLLPFYNEGVAVQHWDYYIIKTSFDF